MIYITCAESVKYRYLTLDFLASNFVCRLYILFRHIHFAVKRCSVFQKNFPAIALI